MKIWIDADGCPRDIREIVFKASERLRVPVDVVANSPVATPSRSWITFTQVPSGQDVADSFIVDRIKAHDLVITSDIPLAARAVEKGALALSHRGELWTEDNVRERLSMRDFMAGLRESGIETGGPRPMDKADRRRFADAFDRLLARRQSP